MITLKEEYADAILDGKKEYEVRTRIPRSLAPGDVIFVHVAGYGDTVLFSFVVNSVDVWSRIGLWNRLWGVLAIKREDYLNYTLGRSRVFAIGISNVNLICNNYKMSYWGVMHAPQWFVEIKV